MRVAIVAEGFLPYISGVTNSVLRVLEHLQRQGHEALVVAPNDQGLPTEYAGAPVIGMNSVGLPGYSSFRVGLTQTGQFERIFADFGPDVVHLASPLVLGYTGVLATSRMSIPSVAVFQTEVPAFAARYGWGSVSNLLWRRIRQIHSLASLTLAPSTYSADQLARHSIPRVQLWPRGVDIERFDPAKRDPALRAELAPNGELLIGFMGRVAAEKQVTDLAALADIEGTRIVVIGDGPQRGLLARMIPDAVFLGTLTGEDLPRAVSSLDVFVHPGEAETFCQSIQEAKACGVPVIAPAVGGPVDLIENGVTGYTYPPGDLAVMRAHVAGLIDDAARRATMGRQARESVLDRTWPHVCDQLLGYYDQAMGQLRHGELKVV